MKLGVENRRMVYILAFLALIALYTTSSAFMGKRNISGSSSSAAAAAAKTGGKEDSRLSKVHRAFWKPQPLVSSLDPTLRFDLLKTSEEREYDAGKVNIFEGKIVIPPPPDNGTKGKGPDVDPGPKQPPPPPPIALKFFGFASKPGEKKKIFLSSGEDLFIGSEGDVINRRYRIVKITNTGVEIEDILNKNKQTIPLTTG